MSSSSDDEWQPEENRDVGAEEDEDAVSEGDEGQDAEDWVCGRWVPGT